MHLTIRQLMVFEAVARNNSFTRAAEELHLTQPAVSMQIKQIEETIGLPLFEHIGKKIFLTEAGREMYHYSRSITQTLSEIEAVMEELKGIKRGRLNIAVASTANYFATHLLASYFKHHENIHYSLDVTNREGLLRHLELNDVDLVIMGQPPEELDVVAESFMENPLVVIAPAAHELCGQKNIPIESLNRETFIMRERGSGTRIAIERFFSEHGIEISTGMEMSSNEAIKQAVGAGLGLGIVSVHTLALELEAGFLEVLDIDKFPITRNWYVVHRKGKRLSPVSEGFRRFVLEQAPSIMKPL